MKTGLSLQDLAAELERQNSAKEDFIADTRSLTLLGGDELHLKDVGEFPVLKLTHEQIASRLKVPKVYYDRLKADLPGLLDTNVNTLFRENPEQRMIRTLDGKARAFLSDGYRRLDNYDLAQAVFPVLSEFPDIDIVSADLTERRMYIKAVLPRIEGEVNVGDKVQAGLVISNSEVGHGSLMVAPMIYRLVCRNGMITPDYGTRKYHLGRRIEGESDQVRALFTDETLKADDEAFFLALRDTVRGVSTQVVFDEIVGQLQGLTENEIEGNPVKAVEKLGNQLSLTQDEQGSVLNHLITGGDLSQWGALNAVTRLANDQESYDRATELEMLGAKVMTMPQRDWAAIASAR